MPTSSKLGNIINLNQQKVYLLENKGKKLRTKYKVHSILKNDTLILLDLNCINNLFFSEILLKDFNYLPERTINNLKVDFINEEKNEVIEIKGLISETEKIKFPYSNANRVVKQLTELSKFNYKVRFVFILLNPKINTIELDKDNLKFIEKFNFARKKKIKIEIYRIYWKETEEHLKKVQYSLKNNIIKIKSPI